MVSPTSGGKGEHGESVEGKASYLTKITDKLEIFSSCQAKDQLTGALKTNYWRSDMMKEVFQCKENVIF